MDSWGGAKRPRYLLAKLIYLKDPQTRGRGVKIPKNLSTWFIDEDNKLIKVTALMVSFSKFIAELKKQYLAHPLRMNAFIFVSFCLIKIIKVDFRTIERHTKESFWLYFELFLFFAFSKIEVEIFARGRWAFYSSLQMLKYRRASRPRVSRRDLEPIRHQFVYIQQHVPTHIYV